MGFVPSCPAKPLPDRNRFYLAFCLSLSLGSATALFAATDRSHNAAAASDYDSPAPHVAAVNPSVHGPRFALENGAAVEYVGMFSADAKFRPPSKHERFFDNAANGPGPAQRQAPPRMLHSYERAVQSFAPPAHATATPDVEALPRRALNNLVTFVYGHAKVMQSPRAITTDSAQRVIVADPAIPAVHVLDPAGKASFRIIGGPGHRIQSAEDVAVDAEDDIYVADSVRGLIVVFDRYGRFLRELGTFHGEPLYERITAIAIDPHAGHLYVADGPRHLITMLDLEGNVLKRMGQGRSGSPAGQLIRRDSLGLKEFNYPIDIAVGGGEVVVLDSGGTRVRIMDLDCNLLAVFSVQHAAADKAGGLGVAANGNVYIAYPDDATIKVYNPHGETLGTFGSAGQRIGQFLGPEGLWIDAENQLYVADTGNVRIDLFALSSATTAAGAGQREPDAIVNDAIVNKDGD